MVIISDNNTQLLLLTAAIVIVCICEATSRHVLMTQGNSEEGHDHSCLQ